MLKHKGKTYQLAKHQPFLVREEITSTVAYQPAANRLIQDVKKDFGIFFTPERIVDFMVGLIDTARHKEKDEMAILEPACGLAQFLIGIKRNYPLLYKKARPLGIEINENIINYLNELKPGDEIKLIKADYLLWHSEQKFDLIIGNPPYGIPSLSEHYTIKIDPATKENYKNLYETWYGKYNVYGAFIEKSIKLLNQAGQLILIVPATFMILDEFKKLREFLSRTGQTKIIYLGPDVFKPEADVASVVLEFNKTETTGSFKLLEYRDKNLWLIKGIPHWQGEIIRFETDYTRQIENICSYILGDIYEVNISPRTPEIKRHPHITQQKPSNGGYLPLLNGKNLKCNRIIYDNLTGYWIKKSDARKLRGYCDTPHIVVGLGFRENGKVAAAYDEKSYPWMGDIYHLTKKDELFNDRYDLTDAQLLEYLNSDYLRKYIKETYREITYHLSITQLKNIPLPTKKEWELIRMEMKNVQESR